MLTLVDSSHSNCTIKPEKYGLYKLGVRSDTEVVVAEKPVFGANVTFNADALVYANCVINSNTILGWIDHSGLSHFIINSSQPINDDNQPSATLPSQFLNADNGLLRVTMPLRIYLLARTPKEIQEHGLCYFTPA